MTGNCAIADRVDSEVFKRAFRYSDFTRRSLAMAIGCNEKSIRRMLKGRWVSYDRAIQLADAFGLSPTDCDI